MTVKTKENEKAISERESGKKSDDRPLQEEDKNPREKRGGSSRKRAVKRTNQRRATRRFTKNRVNAVGGEQGGKYLFLAILGLFLPPFAPAAWLLSQSLRSLAKQDDFLLDNKVYATWVIGLVATIFYLSLALLLASLYIFVPGYSLV